MGAPSPWWTRNHQGGSMVDNMVDNMVCRVGAPSPSAVISVLLRVSPFCGQTGTATGPRAWHALLQAAAGKPPGGEGAVMIMVIGG